MDRNVSHLVIPITKDLFSERPKLLTELAEFYCRFWEKDEHFGEYRICPTCHSYFDCNQVINQGIHSCDGLVSGKPEHPQTELDFAWKTDAVINDIVNTVRLGPDRFFGLVILNQTGKVIGFTWSELKSLDEIRHSSWGDKLTDIIAQNTDNNEVVYFDELGVHPDYRGLHFGKLLVGQTTLWMANNFPNHLGLLRTHQNSHARAIFEKAGFVVFADDTEYGGGRKMLKINKCSDLEPYKLLQN